MKNLILTLSIIIIGICISIAFDDNKKSENNIINNATDENPKERLEWHLRRHNGKVEIDKIRAAQKYLTREFHQTLNKDAYIGGWESLGPKNIGGRVRGIAIHPNNTNTIFAGSASGGIWKTTNGGDTWTIANGSLNTFPIMDIHFHPNNLDSLYAVTGEFNGGHFPGIGVLVSGDGGNTWDILDQPASQDFIYLSKMRFHPNNPDTLFVSGNKTDSITGSDAVIYKSDDKGQSWYELWTDPTPGSTNVYDMEIINSTPLTILIGTSSRGMISTDGGTSFSDMFLVNDNAAAQNYSILRHEVEVCGSNSQVIYLQRYLTKDTLSNSTLYRTDLWRSIDGGASFDLETMTKSTSSSNNVLGRQGNYDNTLWINPINCTQVMMGGIEMYKYTIGDPAVVQISDGDHDIDANKWESLNNSIHVDQHVIIAHPDFNNTTNAVVFVGNDGGIYKTTDFNNVQIGATWEALNEDFEITQFYGGDISLDGELAVAGAQDNHYIFDNNTSDGLKEWETWSRGDGGYAAVNKMQPDTFYTTTQRGNVLRTYDNGASFCHIFSFNSDTQRDCCMCPDFSFNLQDRDFISPFKMNPDDNSNLYIGGEDLYMSTDNGDNWSWIYNTASDTVITAIDVYDEDIIWFGKENSRLYKTENGTNFTLYHEVNTSLPDYQINDIAINPVNPNRVAVVYAGYHQDHIYVTFDAGNNWFSRPLDLEVNVNTVVWHPTNNDVLYVGTNVGVFASSNQGITWSALPYFAENEGPVYVEVTELLFQGDGSSDFPHKLCATTYGRGMWRTTNITHSELYVDKNCSPCGVGTIDKPFKTFREAYEASATGTKITFLSNGTYDETPPNILIDKKIEINHTGTIIIE